MEYTAQIYSKKKNLNISFQKGFEMVYTFAFFPDD